MNRERLKTVRDRIASEPPERLNMAEWHCGTAHCIGGWAQVLEYNTEDPPPGADAGGWLDLTRDQAEALFYADNTDRNLSQLTRDDALAALDSLINADSDDALPVWPDPRA